MNESEQKKLITRYELEFLGTGPSATGSTYGWAMSPDIYFRCTRCGWFLPARTRESVSCSCGSLSIDVDYARIGSDLVDKAIEVYVAKPKRRSQ